MLHGTLHKKKVAIGFTYDEERNGFIPPQPYGFEVSNRDTCSWKPFVFMPQSGNHMWDTEISNWIGVN